MFFILLLKNIKKCFYIMPKTIFAVILLSNAVSYSGWK